MSWDPVWDKIFAERAWGRYPQEDLVRFVAKTFYAVDDRSRVRMLEVGCGPGSGASWFIAREGFRLSGIDASGTAVDRARARFAHEGLDAEFVQGDITCLPWPDNTFDAVVDVGCLTCNSERETAFILAEVLRVMKPGAWHFSMTPKAGCWGDNGVPRIDATTCECVAEGPFAAMGAIRFATAASLERLYAAFQDLQLESLVRTAEGGCHQVAHWILTCRK